MKNLTDMIKGVINKWLEFIKYIQIFMILRQITNTSKTKQ